jgi:hypothetical protein
MEGFKKLPKMQCFKTGGSVTPKFVKAPVEKTTKVAATGDKKAMSKSAAMVPKEKEDKVDISIMKKGGRAKKATGTVKKFVKPAEAKTKAKPIKKFADGGLTGNPNALTMAPQQQQQPQFGNDMPSWYNNLGSLGMPSYGGSNGGPNFNNNNTMNAGGGGGYGGGMGISPGFPGGILDIDRGYPGMDIGEGPQMPPGYNPYGNSSGGPNFNPTFNNNNTMNANGGNGGGYGGSMGGGNPMGNPMGNPQTPQYPPPLNQATGNAGPGGPGSLNVLSNLFGSK